MIDALQARMDLARAPCAPDHGWSKTLDEPHPLPDPRPPNVKTEISLHILAYYMKRMVAVRGPKP